jgi:hypothetical protein
MNIALKRFLTLLKRAVVTLKKPYIFAPIIILAIVVATVAVFYVLGSRPSTPQKVSEKLVTAIVKGQADDAYSLTGSLFRKSSSYNDLVAALNGLTPFVAAGKVVYSDAHLQSSPGQNDSASVVYTVVKDKTYYVRVILEKESKTWKVVSFKASESALKAQDS